MQVLKSRLQQRQVQAGPAYTGLLDCAQQTLRCVRCTWAVAFAVLAYSPRPLSTPASSLAPAPCPLRRHEGVAGFYRGFSANVLRVAPQVRQVRNLCQRAACGAAGASKPGTRAMPLYRLCAASSSTSSTSPPSLNPPPPLPPSSSYPSRQSAVTLVAYERIKAAVEILQGSNTGAA
jgi:hypothetical protein